jgi:hypothetical protein
MARSRMIRPTRNPKQPRLQMSPRQFRALITPAVYADACVYWDMLELGKTLPEPNMTTYMMLATKVKLQVQPEEWSTKALFNQLGVRWRAVTIWNLCPPERFYSEVYGTSQSKDKRMRQYDMDRLLPLVGMYVACVFCGSLESGNDGRSWSVTKQEWCLAHTRRCALRYLIDTYRAPAAEK